MGALDWIWASTVVLLIALVVAQAVWINILLNKFMSRDFRDYVLTKREEQKSTKADKIQVNANPDDFEDLNYISGVG